MVFRVYVYIYQYLYTENGTVYKYTAVSNRKRKARRFSLIRLPFAHRLNGILLFVNLFTKKKMEVIRLLTD
jgi:hypothetical protein